MVEKNFEGNPNARGLPPELQTLYDIGFAIHWLRPHSKKPVKNGWASPGRASPEELIKDFRPGFNPGVRLGASSQIKKLYLAVVDLDVKSPEVDDYTEALQALYNLFPKVRSGPHLKSGRGNGSAHYYILIPSPVKDGEVKARSRKLVKVKIPDVQPSKRDVEHLSMDELADGYRMRPAWEIQLLSHGRQAVLVGAVHPDTGKRYTWGRRITKASDIPLIEDLPIGLNGEHSVPAESEKREGPGRPEKKHYVFADVSIDDFDLPAHHKAAVVSGEGVVDRSHRLFDITLILVQKGYPDNSIISLLTNPDYFLGQASWKGANNTRQRAAHWFERYQLRLAKQRVQKNSDVFDFDEEPEPTKQDDPPPKKPKAVKGKVSNPNPLAADNDPDIFKASLPKNWFGRVPMGITDPTGWQSSLTARPPQKNIPPLIQPTLLNIVLILRNTMDNKAILRRDLFSKLDYWCCDTIWGQKSGDQRSSGDDDRLPIKTWLSETYGIEPNLGLVDEALSVIALENAHHPLQGYLSSLRWDGIPRVANAFRTYFGADMQEPYLSAVTRKFFQACVERAFNPGAAFDHVVVLVGKQGKGKTKSIEILAGKDWLMEGLPNLRDKDAALYLQGAWICEFEELSALARSDQSIVKGFITRNTDRFRPPYGRTRQDFPRTTVFIGTVDKDQFLVDTSGNRRFWPVQVGQLDFEALKRDRDQLWAEAVENFYFDKEVWWLEGEAALQATLIQESKRVHSDEDILRGLFIPWFFSRMKTFAEGSSKIDESMFDFHESLVNKDYGAPGKRCMVWDHSFLAQKIVFGMNDLFITGPFSSLKFEGNNTRNAAKMLRDLGFDAAKRSWGNVWRLNVKQDWLNDFDEYIKL